MAKKATTKAEPEANLFDVDAYQQELEALRNKHLSGVKTRIQELQSQRRTIDEELNKLNAMEGKITGRVIHGGAPKLGERFRATPEQLVEQGQIIYGKLAASKHNEFSSSEMADMIDPKFASRLPKIIAAWNAKNKGTPIHHNGGKKNKSKYLVK